MARRVIRITNLQATVRITFFFFCLAVTYFFFFLEGGVGVVLEENGNKEQQVEEGGVSYKEPVYILSKSGYTWDFTTGENTGCKHRCVFGEDYSKEAMAAAVVYPPEHISSSQYNSRPKGQQWIAFSLESPANYPRWRDRRHMAQFNMSLHYRTTADFPLMGQVAAFFPPVKPDGTIDFTGLPFVPFAVRAKRALLSAVISNCEARNGRAHVLKQLIENKNVSVASYGACNNNEMEPEAKEWSEYPEVFKLLSSMDGFKRKEGLVAIHLFHFAAENSNCDDYHTEKVYQALRVGAVPVYMGGRTIMDFVPEGSVIETRKLRTPADLAAHLLYLASNETAYMEYHAWRTKPVPAHVQSKLAIASQERTPDWFCKLCTKVVERRAKTLEPELTCVGFTVAW